MSLYNIVNGVQPATFFLLPMLGKHPDQYPRFRDCFAGREKNSEKLDPFGIPIKEHGDTPEISVYTRVGGGNREDYEDAISTLRNTEGYVTDYDDDFDCTFATFVFKVPERFIDDFIKVKEGKIKETSQAYRDQLYSVYPKLKEKLDTIFAD